MANLKFKGSIANEKHIHKFELSLFSFVDDGCRIIYSPALDLSGYGKNETEAKASFEVALTSFVDYTSHKKSLLKELTRLGWNVTKAQLKKHKPAKAPELAEMLRVNDYLANIFETKNFKKYNEAVALPM